MKEEYNGPYQKRLNEIDERIANLETHIPMWSKAGAGEKSARALEEISALKKEKERILNGTQEEYEKIESKIAELKQLKEQCLLLEFIKKNRLTKEINNYETKRSNLR